MSPNTTKQDSSNIESPENSAGSGLQIAGGLAGWVILMGYLFLLPGLLGQLLQPLIGT